MKGYLRILRNSLRKLNLSMPKLMRPFTIIKGYLTLRVIFKARILDKLMNLTALEKMKHIPAQKTYYSKYRG